MKKFMVMAGLVMVGVACGTGADMLGEILDAGVPDAGAETPGDGTSMQYVGNSTQTFRDAEGIYTYYAACQTTFGPGHRMCTGNEIIYTVKIPQLSEGFAWYEPSAPCTAVDQAGRTTSTGCQNSLPIACCGPK